MTDVWSTLVGQKSVAAGLAEAARGRGMSHAWLFTGPPGSGRSNAAVSMTSGSSPSRPGFEVDRGPLVAGLMDGGMAGMRGVW